jgi:hypothetical protein
VNNRMTFTVHTELDGYLQDLRNPKLVPLLGDAGGRLAELAELLDTRLANGRQDPVGEVVVLVPPGSAAAPVGAALAERVGGTFAECAPADLPAGAASAQHVVLAALADELSLEMVLNALDMTAKLRRDGRGEAALGVVLGRSLDELSWLIAKGLGYRPRVSPERAQLCIAPMGERGGNDQDGADLSGTRWVVGADTRAEILAPLLARHYGLVSFAAAGREHAIILADTVVCGAGTDSGGRVEAVVGAPSCAFSGACFREGVGTADVILAREIRADVVYANSCMSWRPGHGLVAADYQLTYAFQRGIVAAFIGAVHQMVPDVRLNRLAHRAAAAGASAGQLGILLNRQAASRETPNYVVLGIPWVVPVPAEGPVPLSRLVPLTDEPGTTADNAVRDCLRRVGRAIQALRDLPLTGLLPADNLPELDAQVSAVVALLKGDPSVIHADPEAHSVEHLLAALADAEFGVALDFHDFWQLGETALNEIWEDFLETSAVPGTGRCPYCSGPVANVTGRHPAYPSLSRQVCVCHICGPLLDLPGRSPIEAITIDCSPVWLSPSTVDVTVTVTPAPDSGSDMVAVAVQVARAAARGLLAPLPQRLRLMPGRSTSLRAEIEVGEDAFAHHEHFVRAVVVAGGQVHAAGRPVAVRPRP